METPNITHSQLVDDIAKPGQNLDEVLTRLKELVKRQDTIAKKIKELNERCSSLGYTNERADKA